LGLPTSGNYDLTASHPEYGNLPPQLGVSVQDNLENVTFFLPPELNAIENGDFEEPGGWETGGTEMPARVRGDAHSGEYVLQFSTQPQAARDSSEHNDSTLQSTSGWTSTISQTVTLPVEALEITLGWIYRVEGVAETGDTFAVTVEGATGSLSKSLPLEPTSWVHDWIDVTELAGQVVTVRFAQNRASMGHLLTVQLDEVALGPTIPILIYLPLIWAAHQ
jgi:hypothetical protein